MRRILFIAVAIGLLSVVAHAEDNAGLGKVGCALDRPAGSKDFTVIWVAANGPAAEAGLKVGDVVTEIGGVPANIISSDEAHKFLTGFVGGTLSLHILDGASGDRGIAIPYKPPIDVYLPVAQAGDARAQFALGLYYDLSSSKDHFTAAAQWYRAAADQNLPEAEANLGRLTKYGWGIAKNPAGAVALFRKAASQDDPFAERELGIAYLEGEGVDRSDHDAYAWFYRAAAMHGDATAERNLGFLYREGRGVPRDYKTALHWYAVAAAQNDASAEWGLAYMYQRGWGVEQNFGESLKWYRMAEKSLPHNESLKRMIALTSLLAFLKNRDSASFDLASFASVFHREIVFWFYVLSAIYVASGFVLLLLSFKKSGKAPRILEALGWLVFYLESQGVAVVVLFLFGNTFSADLLLVATVLTGVLPIFFSTLGPVRKRIWNSSPLSWNSTVLYAAGCIVAVALVDVSYEEIFHFVLKSPLPHQPTEVFIGKAMQGSAWLAYATVAFALPVTEEIIFRGYLFDAMRHRFSGTTTIIVTALLFSLVHFQAFYFALLFGMGLVLGWARLKTDSLRLPIVLHALNNAFFLATFH